MPSHQLKNIYKTDGINKENKKPNGNVQGNKKVLKTSKPIQPAPAKVKGVSVPRKPNNIEAALEQLDTDELNEQIERMKINFPDSHLVWLKGVSVLSQVVVAYTFHECMMYFPDNLVS